ncbi:putative ABC transporter permease [Raoultibacter massiliensis]|uniref:ABC transporter permease n=1 Tax=Raoultibacter massiliensis TaxID=1852371 RepID=A0ABV1JCZ1_9ACTN|nr:putative ABC transporter permease [Raoultibacter massiliensis]
MGKQTEKTGSDQIEADEGRGESSASNPSVDPSSPHDAKAACEENPKENPFVEFATELKAQIFHNQGFLKIDYFTMFWLFVAGSVIGLTVETIYHAIVFGGWESRAGLVWGPFSPIYGSGAVLLTLFLNRYYHSHNLVIFLVSMVVGSAIEYVTSWGMETFWGAIAWDYTGTFGSIQGRTNFFFGMMWGMLGLVWVRIIMPVVKRVFSHVDSKNKVARVLTVLMTLFMAANIVCTCLALDRESQRMANIPATDPIQKFCDDVFPDSYLQARFQNMTVTAKK